MFSPTFLSLSCSLLHLSFSSPFLFPFHSPSLSLGTSITAATATATATADAADTTTAPTTGTATATPTATATATIRNYLCHYIPVSRHPRNRMIWCSRPACSVWVCLVWRLRFLRVSTIFITFPSIFYDFHRFLVPRSHPGVSGSFGEFGDGRTPKN